MLLIFQIIFFELVAVNSPYITTRILAVSSLRVNEPGLVVTHFFEIVILNIK